ncbi:hypothetical protein CBL_04677 [Carabus blaptoides fortunei]
MDKKLVIVFLILNFVNVFSKPLEENTATVIQGSASDFRSNTNARALKLTDNKEAVTIKPIRPVKPCGLVGGDCTEDALEVVYKLEEQRRFGEQTKTTPKPNDYLEINVESQNIFVTKGQKQKKGR